MRHHQQEFTTEVTAEHLDALHTDTDTQTHTHTRTHTKRGTTDLAQRHGNFIEKEFLGQ